MQNSGLTSEEEYISDLIVEAFNCFVKLEQTHPDEKNDFKNAVHQLQQLLVMRMARRDCPDYWPSYNKGASK